MSDIKEVYRNRLPHIAPVGAIFFVTFRLADSLPQHIVRQLKWELERAIEAIRRKELPPWEEKEQIEAARHRFFRQYDHQLDHQPYGSCCLRQPEVAQLIMDRLFEFHEVYYSLDACCIMPNHVHALLAFHQQLKNEQGFIIAEEPESYMQLDKVMQLIKGGSAYLANKVLQRSGTFWQKDSFDHFIRSEQEWWEKMSYVVNNPVEAGLVTEWRAWPFSYCPYL